MIGDTEGRARHHHVDADEGLRGATGRRIWRIGRTGRLTAAGATDVLAEPVPASVVLVVHVACRRNGAPRLASTHAPTCGHTAI